MKTSYVPSLDKFVRSATDGVDLYRLPSGTTVIVHTGNTEYRLVVSDGADVVIQGGRFFPTPTPAHVEGCSAGGSLLKIGCIAVGLCLELTANGERIVISPVRALAAQWKPDTSTH